MTVVEFVVVAVAGGAGAVLRALVDALVMRGRTDRFPLGILVVNVTGSLALGVVAGAAVGGVLAAVIGIGLLGGYTTFSTVSVETVLLAERGRRRRALLNAGGTLVACVAAAGLGLTVGALIAGR